MVEFFASMVVSSVMSLQIMGRIAYLALPAGRNRMNSELVTSLVPIRNGREMVTGTNTSFARRPCSDLDEPIVNVPGSTRRNTWPEAILTVVSILDRATASCDRKTAVTVCGYPGRGVTVRDQVS